MEATVHGSTGPSPPVGRTAELALIAAFLREAAGTGAALVMTGESGSGKTLLLDIAADMAAASGAVVLRASGVAVPATGGFSGLGQVLRPLMPHLPELADAHRKALEVPLGFAEEPLADRLLVSTAALELLWHASGEGAVLIVVDDLQWLDRPSAAVLGFVARRVSGSRIGFLGAARPGDDGFFDRSGLPEHALGPLAGDAAGELLASRFPGLAAEVRARVLAEAGGNPLALLELPAALSDAQRTAAVVLPAALPLTGRLREAFAPRIAGLPAPARRLLLAAALDGTGDPRIITAPGALDATARARLLHADEQGRLAFAHPLVRSAAVELASDDEQQAAHRELAALFSDQPDRRAWHLAGAARQPDEHLAAALEQAAHRSLQRGDFRDAMAALTRAAELSVAPADRGRRLARAAYIGVGGTGERERGATLLTTALRQDGGIRDSLEAAVASAYLLLSGSGDSDTACRLLVAAIEAAAQGDAGLEEALHGLMLACFFDGRRERWEQFQQVFSRSSAGLSDALQLCAEVVTSPASATERSRGRLSAAIGGIADEADPVRITLVAAAAAAVDRLPECDAALDRVVRDGRCGGAVAWAILALDLQAADSFRTGRWGLAGQQVAESLRLCQEHGYVLPAWPARYVQAALAAVRGDYATARALTDEMLQWAGPRMMRSILCYAWHVRSLAAIASGDFEDAYRWATQISPVGHLPARVPNVVYVEASLVEACMRTNRQAEAAAHVAAMKAAGIENISARFRLMVTGCAAIAAPDFTAASDLFTQALTTPGIERWPFDLARIRLLHGERLRRAGLASQARAQLTAALEIFQNLGALPWVSRARDELRATGQSRARGGTTTDRRLTPQEHRVATLAARGLRNKEIAGQLSLSERTVAAHLHRVFPKLRVTSRAGLRDALAALLPREETASEAGRAGARSGLQGHKLTGDARDEVLERPGENRWPNDELT